MKPPKYTRHHLKPNTQRPITCPRCKRSLMAARLANMKVGDTAQNLKNSDSANLRSREELVSRADAATLLNTSERSLMAARLANMQQGQRTDLQHSANLPNVSQEQAAAMLNTSERTVNAAKAVLNRGTPEKDFMQQVITLAQLNGWLCYHVFDSRKSSPGFPDLTMVRGSRLLFIELKSEKGKATPEQAHWLEALSKVETVSTYLWRPSSWQQIEEVLRGRR